MSGLVSSSPKLVLVLFLISGQPAVLFLLLPFYFFDTFLTIPMLSLQKRLWFGELHVLFQLLAELQNTF